MKKITSLILTLFSVSALMAQSEYLSIPLGDTTVTVPRLSPIPSDNGMTISLDGVWQFSVDASKGDYSSKIEVPGQWLQQGFTVPAGQWAAYRRDVEVPSKWKNDRIFIRFDAVFSGCEVFFNGRKVTDHIGGFTPFEADVTDFVKTGVKNELTVKVVSETIADSTASAAKYACHQLGGISRKVKMFALPKTNIAYLHATTKFDKDFKNAQLDVEYILDNNGSDKIDGAKLEFSVKDNSTNEFIFKKEEQVSAKSGSLQNFRMNVKSPKKWDPEHPNLYTLLVKLTSPDKSSETVNKTIGFREVRVNGTKMYVNGSQILLRGVNHHEVMPLRGRSVTGDTWKKDVELFRNANINYIRTSHYPPSEELIEACDSMGMFLEVEAPFCWAHETNVPDKYRKTVLEDQTLSMVNAFKTHPAILMWSMGNESLKYTEYFSHTAKVVGKLDSLRPRIFSQWSFEGDNFELEVTNLHYPGLDLGRLQKTQRPTTFDEFCHLNAYNRLEYLTDPSVRDTWGVGVERMWELMRSTRAVLGGGIWAGIDDTFFLPDGKAYGYGTWGPVDCWRREKPEYWHLKKIFSPVKISADTKDDKIVELTIENRFLFSDLSECDIKWYSGSENGTIKVSGKPSESVKSTIKLNSDIYTNKSLKIVATDPRGVEVDVYEFPLSGDITVNQRDLSKPVSVSENGKDIIVSSGDLSVNINGNTGKMLVTKSGRTVLEGMPKLMLLPLTPEGYGIQMLGVDHDDWNIFSDVCKNRVIKSININNSNKYAEIVVSEEYKEAFGSFTIKVYGQSDIGFSYQYEVKEPVSPRQVGMAFELPSSFDNLSWQRYGQWNYYPEDHIGRLKGEALAMNSQKNSGPAGPSWEPNCLWKDDCTKWGTNDFRSTKHNILSSTLSSKADNVSFGVVSDGRINTRSWLDNDKTNFFVGPFSNLGSERFFRDHAKEFDKPLKKKDIITGDFDVVIK